MSLVYDLLPPVFERCPGWYRAPRSCECEVAKMHSTSCFSDSNFNVTCSSKWEGIFLVVVFFFLYGASEVLL